jgi:chaperonin GroEL
MNHFKVRSQPPKRIDIEPHDIVAQTLSTIEAVVGCTLGPGGRPVLLDRQETGLPPFLTKDGVTAFKALGFRDPRADAFMELVRDPATRTATEAGDGTTTATILAAGLFDRIHNFCYANPEHSPQLVVRRVTALLESGYDFLRSKAVAASFHLPDGSEDVAGTAMLRTVARVSGNGDEALAVAATDACRMAGDFGNVVLAEQSGPDGYRVEPVKGYTLAIGYEESCKSLWYGWVNDQVGLRIRLERPRFLLLNGRVRKLVALREPLDKLQQLWSAIQVGEVNEVARLLQEDGVIAEGAWAKKDPTAQTIVNDYMRNFTPAVVIVATGFSDDALSEMMANYASPDHLKLVPLLLPQGPAQAYQQQLLLDIGAVTGASVLDQVTRPVATSKLADFGPGIESFECYRHSSVIVGQARETAPTQQLQNEYSRKLAQRIQEVSKQAKEMAVSKLDAGLAAERMAKLSGGLARLIVTGSSNGEIRERRDRAEDAVCAVRHAIRSGCLPGAGWGLNRRRSWIQRTIS